MLRDMGNSEVVLLKNKYLVQHNALTMARYELISAEKDMIYMLLAQLGTDDPLDKVYHVYIKDIEKVTGREISYEQARKATMKLISRVYSIVEGKDLLQVSMISSARYIKGMGKVAIRIDPEVRPYLFGLKTNFTRYGLFMAMSVKSKYSKRLYEMLSQFRHTGIMRISVDELKSRLKLLDPQSGKEKYVMWTMFANKVLEVAKNELSRYTDVEFTYEAKKKGRKFTDLEFKIRCIPGRSALKFDQVNDSVCKRLTSEFKLSTWQAHLIAAHVPEEDIHRTLYEIKLKKLNGELSNVGGFTAQTFENKYQLGLVGGKAAGLERPTPVGEHPRASKSKPLGGAYAQEPVAIGAYMKGRF